MPNKSDLYSGTLKAVVEDCVEGYLLDKGYKFTVVVCDANNPDDVVDLLDCATEQEAATVAYLINTGGNPYESKCGS